MEKTLAPWFEVKAEDVKYRTPERDGGLWGKGGHSVWSLSFLDCGWGSSTGVCN